MKKIVLCMTLFFTFQLAANLPLPRALVCSYLILRKDDSVCLGRRINTGFYDEEYGLIAGHVELGETATEGMIREAKEEAGIDIDPSNLRCVHVMHRFWKRNPPVKTNIDVFYECTEYSGVIKNCEPEKCGGWVFFKLDEIPEDTMDYLKVVLEEYSQGHFYSEFGFEDIFLQ